jgi:hypothetical protein
MRRFIYLMLLGLGIFIFFTVTVIVNGQEEEVPTATPDGSDIHEPNNNFETATSMLLGQNQRLSLLVGDVDYIRIYLKAGQIVRLTAAPLEFGDTSLTVFGSNGEQLAFNDDLSATDRSASVVFQAAAEDFYIVLIQSPVPVNGLIEYDFYSSLQMPTPTPTLIPTSTPGPTSTPAPTGTASPTETPVPSPTPLNSIDAGEPNNNPAEAYQIVPNQEYQMTLGPSGWDDHDFYSFLGKAWINYSCETETAEIDTTIRMYTGAIGAGELVAENDDAGGGLISSAATFQPETDQWIFVVVESRAGAGGYIFSCNIFTPVMVMPVVSSAGNESGSGESAGSDDGEASDELVSEEPIPAITSLAVAVFNDRNADEIMNMGEAVNDVFVVTTPLGGSWSVQEKTQNGLVVLNEDMTGITHLIVSVPYLYYSQIVEIKKLNGVINIAIEAPVLPVVLP